MAWLRIAAGLAHSAVAVSALWLHFSGSHRQPKHAAFPWSYHFLSPEELSFPASAWSASGVVLLASAGSRSWIASLSSQHDTVPCLFGCREVSAVGIGESEGSTHCIVGRKGPGMELKRGDGKETCTVSILLWVSGRDSGESACWECPLMSGKFPGLDPTRSDKAWGFYPQLLPGDPKQVLWTALLSLFANQDKGNVQYLPSSWGLLPGEQENPLEDRQPSSPSPAGMTHQNSFPNAEVWRGAQGVDHTHSGEVWCCVSWYASSC